MISTKTTVSAYWFGAPGYTAVLVRFTLEGDNGSYDFVLPPRSSERVSKGVAPGTYRVKDVFVSGRPSGGYPDNGNIDMLEALPDKKEITVAAGQTAELKFMVTLYGGGSGGGL